MLKKSILFSFIIFNLLSFSINSYADNNNTVMCTSVAASCSFSNNTNEKRELSINISQLFPHASFHCYIFSDVVLKLKNVIVEPANITYKFPASWEKVIEPIDIYNNTDKQGTMRMIFIIPPQSGGNMSCTQR